MLFSDSQDLVDICGPVSFTEVDGAIRQECFEPQIEGVMAALIPEDFNIDIQTTGDITGLNHGDSKLVAMQVVMHSQQHVVFRRLRAETCSLQGAYINASSSLEVQKLRVHAGKGGFTVGKRLGLDSDAIINS